MVSKKIKSSAALLTAIQDACDSDLDILLVSLCTTDGFSIESASIDSLTKETDKLSAIASTISALSESSSQEILKDHFKITIIESESGNLLFVRTTYLDHPCVLSIAANKKMALAVARHKTRLLSEQITNLTS